MVLAQAARILRVDLDEAEDLCDAIGGDPDHLNADDLEEMVRVIERDENEDDEDFEDEDDDLEE